MSSSEKDVPPASAEKTPALRARKSPLWMRLLLLLGSLATVWLGFELVLRAIGAKPQTATTLSTYFQQDTMTGWTGVPNVSCRLATVNYDAIISHDADGFRCCALESTIDDDARFDGEVVWCVGDSGTWGLGVNDGATYVDVLNQLAPPTQRFRNLGICAFSSVQEYLLLKQQFEQGRRPDRVIILFCGNDLEDNMNDNNHSPPRAYIDLCDGEPRWYNYPVRPSASWSARAWLKNHSLAYNYVYFYAKRATLALREWRDGRRADQAISVEPGQRSRSELSDQQQMQMRVLREAYLAAKRLCDWHGVRLAVAVELDGVVADSVRSTCGELSISVLDLSKRLNDYRMGGRDLGALHFKTDPHYNEAGHRVLAEAMYAELQQQQQAQAGSPPVPPRSVAQAMAAPQSPRERLRRK